MNLFSRIVMIIHLTALISDWEPDRIRDYIINNPVKWDYH